MKTALLLLVLAQAPDAPKRVVLTPEQANAAHARQVACETERDELRKAPMVSPVAVVIIAALALTLGAGAGIGIYEAARKK
jgi:hypothetical protein